MRPLREPRTASGIQLKRERTMRTMGKRLTSGMSTGIGALAIVLLIARPASAGEAAPYPRTGDEVAQTDKSDYVVSEPVRLTGTGFAAGTELTLRIVQPDGSSGDYVATVLGPGETPLASLSFRAKAAGGASVPTAEKAPFGKLPLAFVPNAGQTDERVRFLVHAGRGATFFFTDEEAVFVFRKGSGEKSKGIVLRLGLLGANARAAVEGDRLLEGKVNYLI